MSQSVATLKAIKDWEIYSIPMDTATDGVINRPMLFLNNYLFGTIAIYFFYI
jgi:hypothetical protein